MKIILLQNTVCNGKYYKNGESVNLDDATAKRWINAKLGYSEKADATAVKADSTGKAISNTDKATTAVKTAKAAKKPTTANKSGKKAK